MKHVHFIGIGGIGMSGIAQILISKGYTVSGSDLKRSHITDRLALAGASVYVGHSAANVFGADTVVISSAISEKNPELAFARENGLEVMQRAQVLGFLMQTQKGIAVAGTHGKTTTTSMISSVMRYNKLDPTVVVGGELASISSNASIGSGSYLVAEADESDASFLHLSPMHAIITNIDSDVNLNVEPYASCHNDYEQVMKTISRVFLEFTDRVCDGGAIVLCSDSEYVRKILPSISRPYITYGIKHDADFRAEDIVLSDYCSVSRIYCKSSFLGELKLRVPGRHNVQNALACIAICMEIGLDFDAIAAALEVFGGLKRRFDVLGNMNGIMVVDDYAHNPSKLRAAVHAAKTGNAKRVIAVFQPHRYSRTRFLMNELSEAFYEADILVVADIYSAGEKVDPEINSSDLASLIKKKSPNVDVHYIPERKDILHWLLANAEKGDVVITLGAGDICNVSEMFYSKLSSQPSYSPLLSINESLFASPVE